MVNYGVSRGCRTCKARRKKCDESRPACRRCIEARRTCLGYQDDLNLIVRHWTAPAETNPLDHVLSWESRNLARCTDAEIEECAWVTFFHDYCLVPKNGRLSRGYLEGLRDLLHHAGPSSNVAQATTVVALANVGTKLNRPALIQKARIRYSDLLHSFQMMISNATAINTAELLMTAVILGLYEIITATKAHPSNHGSHSHGVYAILVTEHSPLGLLNRSHTFQISNPLCLRGSLEAPGILRAPALPLSIQSLDSLLINSWPLLCSAESLLSDPVTIAEDLVQKLEEAKHLNKKFSNWADTQPDEWMPTPIAFTDTQAIYPTPPWLSGRVDTYLDFYVAVVWNTYRKNRIMILDVIIRCAKRLENGKNTYRHEILQVEELVSDMMASIPFHIVENLASFVPEYESTLRPTITPGKSIGGLFLMHPLFVTSHLSVVYPRYQAEMRCCLAWIGKYMGIGEASMLSNRSTTFPNPSVANGYALIFAGMLFTGSDAT